MQNNITVNNLDHLGLVAGMIDELNIVENIDKIIPSYSEDKKLSHGELVKAMILNGLGYVNKQLYLVSSFFEDKPLDILFKRDIQAEWINDDALGRTLDVIYEHGVSGLYENIALDAIDRLGLLPDTLHLDSTSFHLDGAYKAYQESSSDSDKPSAVNIVKGYSRDHHPNLNQVVLNLLTEHKAGIPIQMKVADGNQVDSQAFVAFVKSHIQSLENSIKSRLKLIADAALFTKKGIEAIKESGIAFISRVPMTIKEAKSLVQHFDKSAFVTLDENYQAIESSIEYEGVKQKWVLYKSLSAQSKESKTLLKNITQQSSKEMKQIQKFIKTVYFCEADANEALDTTKALLKRAQILKSTLIKRAKYKRGRRKKDATPSHYEYQWQLTCASDITKVNEEVQLRSGLFILATNDIELSPKDLLQEYKSQQRVERGFRFLKSPEFLIDSFYLKKAERIESMLMIMTLCLMVYSALEYRIREELKEQDKTFPNQLGKEVQNPTARWIFQNFFAIHLVTMSEIREVVGIQDKHLLILQLLGLEYGIYYGVKSGGNDTMEIDGRGGAE